MCVTTDNSGSDAVIEVFLAALPSMKIELQIDVASVIG